jgi:hypothetical protein
MPDIKDEFESVTWIPDYLYWDDGRRMYNTHSEDLSKLSMAAHINSLFDGWIAAKKFYTTKAIPE